MTILAPLLLLTTTALVGCTASPAAPGTDPTSTEGSTAPNPFVTESAASDAGMLPSCEAVASVVSSLTTGLEYDAALSLKQTSPEAYAQRVCVWVSADGATQVGVTLAAIDFLDTELAAYGALPNALADERLAEHGAVLQTFQTGDADDGHLDGALYLFDLRYSVTIQGLTTAGASADLLPQLTVVDSVDAAFAVRDLIG